VIETAAIKRVFGAATRIPVSSTKSMHGHLMGATAAVEFIASVLAIKHRAVPPTANLRVADPECDLDYVPNHGRKEIGVRTVMSNSFAFGGSNAVLIARAFGG
jgi:3-oxoacyl-[acyl-carrier-protein] synthase II